VFWLLLVLMFTATAIPTFGEELGEEAAGLAASLDESLLLTFIGIFLIGLALNLTPCVYPMLAITVSIFGQQGESKSTQVFLRALVYVLGISTMYSILGLIAALTGGLFGSILQSPVVLLLISLLFFVLSLSMFGFYELQMPSSLLSRLGGQRSASLFGTWLSGLFVGIFAAPCVGPPVIGLLTLVGHRGDPMFGFLVFFVLSLGLGFPYLILGTFTGLLQKLPRSGAWMNWVKKLMGIILIAVGCFYLALAINPAMAFILIPVTLFVGGIYLGLLEKSQTGSPYFSVFKRLAGAGLIVVAVLGYRAGQVPAIDWQPYSGQITDKQRASAIYFSASWCIPCLELDRRTFTDKAAIEKMNEIQRFKVDLSHYDSEESQQLREKYRIAGVPTIVFLNSSGQEIRKERVVGYISPDELIARIDRVIASAQTEVAAADEAILEDAAEDPSEVFLIADVAWITPGSTFKLAALFKMRENWYIYWLNPGDSGTDPQIEWQLPEGFEAGQPAWPAPQRFDSPPFATFGHLHELLLAYPVRAPETLAIDSTIKISANISWLVCEDICISQNATVNLELAVKSEPPPADAKWSEEFARAAAALPSTADDWNFSASHDGRSAKLVIQPPQQVDVKALSGASFFPAQQGVFRHGSIKTSLDSGQLTVSMQRTGLPLAEKMTGVLVLPNAPTGQPRHLEVTAEWQ
jgi:thiol:disulfide interchange protein DsbD